jgi:hypothetical protein
MTEPRSKLPWVWTPMGVAFTAGMLVIRTVVRHAEHPTAQPHTPHAPPRPAAIAVADGEPGDVGAAAVFAWAAGSRPDVPTDAVRDALAWSGTPDDVRSSTTFRFGPDTVEAVGVTPGPDDPDLTGRWASAVRGRTFDVLQIHDRTRTRPGVYRLTTTRLYLEQGVRFARTVDNGWEVVGPDRDCRYVESLAVSFGDESVGAATAGPFDGLGPDALNEVPCASMSELRRTELLRDGVAEYRISE